ncbi:hypothetical protein NDS46_22010 [Paenibacillus thiaminolyticus]|uniref:hypothetical protein n=1 Tax=Paenibacillus thiaminolyticus TaxID=49283 RepID=UPI00232E2FF4|nr:hypothetical protein [Paenibacillus thiaminolyticus]WCF06990.1 hypothetical protein NDS46_22010 [Paenibacillus thiaminolyticus]
MNKSVIHTYAARTDYLHDNSQTDLEKSKPAPLVLYSCYRRSADANGAGRDRNMRVGQCSDG